jgi:hypothetical protein
VGSGLGLRGPCATDTGGKSKTSAPDEVEIFEDGARQTLKSYTYQPLKLDVTDRVPVPGAVTATE